ncbi:hypothetical protein ACJMK2_035638 [Sinanodonta woodiana]|uniref:Uncharacterized protein n=1 Tax=Sinanodonta woodiana TaxID=1069815 RepID=A0ABD3WVL0_SINWO
MWGIFLESNSCHLKLDKPGSIKCNIVLIKNGRVPSDIQHFPEWPKYLPDDVMDLKRKPTNPQVNNHLARYLIPSALMLQAMSLVRNKAFHGEFSPSTYIAVLSLSWTPKWHKRFFASSREI